MVTSLPLCAHTNALVACNRKDIQTDLPPEIRKFCELFSLLHVNRNNPDETFYRSPVLQRIQHAENAILDFKKAKLYHRRAFVTFATTS